MNSRAEADGGSNEPRIRLPLQSRFAAVGGLAPATTLEIAGVQPPTAAPATSATPAAETQPGALYVPYVPAAPHVPTGPTKVVTGDLHPRHVDFAQISSTPSGQSVWRIIYGTELSGGLTGQTEDIEFQIMEADNTSAIDSAGTFTGSVDGLEGGFVFRSQGVQNTDGSFVMDFVIVRGSGHGKLVGLTGRYTVVATREHCGPDDPACVTLVTYAGTYRLPS